MVDLSISRESKNPSIFTKGSLSKQTLPFSFFLSFRLFLSLCGSSRSFLISRRLIGIERRYTIEKSFEVLSILE